MRLATRRLKESTAVTASMHICNMFLRHSERLALGIVLLMFLEAVVAQESLDIDSDLRGEGHLLNRNRKVEKTLGAQLDPSLFCDQSSSFSCKPYFKHSTDRLGHKKPLYAGEAICHHQYMFGVTIDGAFQWQDCSTNTTKIFYKSSADDVYFVMKPDASWNVYENGQLKWKEECHLDVHFYPQCLSHVGLDCPYIHLRKSGRIVLNFIDENGSWEALSASQLYDSVDKDEMWKAHQSDGN